MDLVLIYVLVGLAISLALFSAWRAHVPPQQRNVYDLQVRVADLEFAIAKLSESITREQRRALAAGARDAKDAKHNKHEALAAEAAALLSTTPATLATPTKSPQEEHAARKAALRVRAGLTGNLLPPR